MTEEVKNQNVDVEVKTPTEQGNFIVEIREMAKLVKEQKRTESELQTKVDKMEKDLDTFEKKNQELSGKLAEQAKSADEQKKVIEALEKYAAKNRSGTNVITKDGIEILNPELVDAYNRYFSCQNKNILTQNDAEINDFMKGSYNHKINVPIINNSVKNFGVFFNGNKSIELERKYLRTDVNDFGGILVPPELMPTLIRRLTEISPVRQYADSRTTYSNELNIPVRNVLVRGQWGYEGATTIANSQSQYTRPSIHMKRLQVTVPLTIEELMDSPLDMQAEVSADVNEEFARIEGQGFITGDDVLQVEGLMTNPNISVTNSGNATNLTSDSLITMFGAIKHKSYGNQMYDRIYAFNRRTWIKILQLKDGIGRYMWNLGDIKNQIPNTILGAPYFLAPDMDDVGANKYPVIMGDFKKGYMIVDRMLMYMVRDEVTAPGFIKYTFIRRLGAKVILPEAFNKLYIHV